MSKKGFILVMIFDVICASKFLCSMYLAPSKISGAGMGVFTGKKLWKGKLLEDAPNVVIQSKWIRNSQLFNYVYGAGEDGYSMVTFGPSMLFNHRQRKDIEQHFATGKVPDMDSNFLDAHTTFALSTYEVLRNINRGEEIFAEYGGSTWFSSRGIDDYEPKDDTTENYSLEDLKSNGFCLNNIYLNNSPIPLAGKGVYTREAHRSGEIVHITPVVILSKQAILDASYNSLLINYCIQFPNDSDVLLLPLTLSAMMNHGVGERRSNVRMEWHVNEKPDSVSTASTPSMTMNENKTIHELKSNPYASLYIKYIAIKDISVDEELLLDYGTSWETAWRKYLDEFSSWAQSETSHSEYSSPQFRYAIEAPLNLHTKDILDTKNLSPSTSMSEEKVVGREGSLSDASSTSRLIEESKRYFSSAGDDRHSCSEVAINN